MQKITPFLWFDNVAEEAVKFYTSLFDNAKIKNTMRYDKASSEASGMPEGSVLTIDFELEGEGFGALNGGPIFKFTPAVSLFVNCKNEQEIDNLWAKLSAGGSILMPFNKYPFSEKYGWVNDRYGLSWQLSIGTGTQKIRPCLMFVGNQNGKAEEAINFYTSLFDNSGIAMMARYDENDKDTKGNLKHAVFSLSGQEFIAMDSGLSHKFTFTEAVSFLINCKTQEEVDKLWEKLSAVPEFEQCGWLKDKFGVSWQIVPTILDKLLSDPDPEKAGRVMQAMLTMKKIDIKALEEAYAKQ